MDGCMRLRAAAAAAAAGQWETEEGRAHDDDTTAPTCTSPHLIDTSLWSCTNSLPTARSCLTYPNDFVPLPLSFCSSPYSPTHVLFSFDVQAPVLPVAAHSSLRR